MSTSPPRIGCSRPTSPSVCASDPQRSTLAEIGKDSAGRRLTKLAVSPSPIPSSPGTAGSLPANLTAPNSVLHPDGPARRPNRNSLCASPWRTRAEDTTAWSELWPISATWFPSDREQPSSAIRDPAGAQSEPAYCREGFHRLPHGRPGWYRLLHGRSADVARSHHLLRPVLYSSGIAPRHPRRFDETSHRRVEGSCSHRLGGLLKFYSRVAINGSHQDISSGSPGHQALTQEFSHFVRSVHMLTAPGHGL